MNTIKGTATGRHTGEVDFVTTSGEILVLDGLVESTEEAGTYECHDQHGRRWTFVDFEDHAELSAV